LLCLSANWRFLLNSVLTVATENLEHHKHPVLICGASWVRSPMGDLSFVQRN